jgi:hypothetical protein
VQTEGQAAPTVIHHARQQRVAWRGAQALADPVGEAQGQHHGPAPGQGQQRPRQGGEAIAADHPALGMAVAIHEDPGKQLQQAGGRLGDALDQAKCPGPSQQDRGQE